MQPAPPARNHAEGVTRAPLRSSNKPRDVRLWQMVLKNDFAAPNAQHRFKIAAAYAISIQIACCSDSIVAFGRIADDFFDSIGHQRTWQLMPTKTRNVYRPP